ncbi:MAG: WbqC family protein [Deltaproteobacteria bacterium]
MVILMENQILPPVSVLNAMLRADTVLIEKFDTYQKRTYRNRFVIATPQGRYILSVPLKQGKTRMFFTDVEISYHDLWVTTLTNNLRSNYSSSPFFEHYFDKLIDIFRMNHQYLFELNNELREFILNNMGIKLNISFTNKYQKTYPDEIIDIRDKHLPSGGKFLIQNPVPYSQVFEDKTGFLNDLSCIDLLFNTGNYAGKYLDY